MYEEHITDTDKFADKKREMGLERLNKGGPEYLSEICNEYDQAEIMKVINFMAIGYWSQAEELWEDIFSNYCHDDDEVIQALTEDKGDYDDYAYEQAKDRRLEEKWEEERLNRRVT